MLSLWFFVNTLLWSINIEIGGLKLGLNVVILSIFGVIWFGKRWIGANQFISRYSVKVLSGFTFFILISWMVANTGICTDKLHKFIFTAPLFLALVFLGLEIGWRANEEDWLKLQNIAGWILLAAFAGFVVEFLLPGWFPNGAKYRVNGAYSGIFNEPSHVAFSLFPSIIILLLADNKGLRRLGVLALLSLVLFSRSSTLLVLIMVWILYRVIARRQIVKGAMAVMGVGLLVMLLSAVDYSTFVEPTLNRINGIIAGHGSTDNVSSLVYLQGWEDARANLLRTYGMGLGFNMMGCSPLPDVPAREVLLSGAGLYLNSEDGSFLFSKLVSETGLIGVATLVAVAGWFIRIESAIHRSRLDSSSYAIRVQAALIFLFLIATFLRGGSYFNAGMLLWLVAASASVKWYKIRVAEKGEP